MIIDRPCPWCGTVTTLLVNAAGYHAWKGGALIQDALPELGPDGREVLLTGICAPCWDTL